LSEKHKNYEKSFRARLTNSKLGAALMALAFLPVVGVVDNVTRLQGDYDTIALQKQDEIELLSANIHNEPLVQIFNTSFKEANPEQILAENKPDIACFQEISEEDALSLSYYGDVVFVSNNQAPLNGKVGIAIVSRRKIENVDFINPDNDNRPAIIARIDNLRIACLHLTANEGIAENQLQKIMNVASGLDIIMGDLNLRPEKANEIIGDFKYSSPTNKASLLADRKTGRGAIDRIIVTGTSKLLMNSATGDLIFIHSDHQGIIVVIETSNWANVDMREFKGVD
jgi:endonuclease/exonuclease/phosphatase family metal-dependent hydrolase